MVNVSTNNEDWVFVTDKGERRKAYYISSKWQDEDENEYYRLHCMYWFGDWIESLPSGMWKAYGPSYRAIYDVTDDMMLLIKLKW